MSCEIYGFGLISVLPLFTLKLLEMKAGEDASEKIKNTEENKKLSAEKDVEAKDVLKKLNSKLEIIGNLVHDSVPVSIDEVWHPASLHLFYSWLCLPFF